MHFETPSVVQLWENFSFSWWSDNKYWVRIAGISLIVLSFLKEPPWNIYIIETIVEQVKSRLCYCYGNLFYFFFLKAKKLCHPQTQKIKWYVDTNITKRTNVLLYENGSRHSRVVLSLFEDRLPPTRSLVQPPHDLKWLPRGSECYLLNLP